jgi:NTP pyrophosphatase (non-canonical NTP hydrolase)
METPQSVYEWIKATFPEWKGTPGRALAVVEETVELALAAGLQPEQLQTAVDLAVQKFRARESAGEPPESDEGEVADTLLCLYAYAYERGIDPFEALEKKMKKNRSKPLSHFQAKTREKKKLGLALDTL